MDLWVLKILAVLIIFVAIFIPAIIPLKVSEWFLQRGEHGTFMLSVITCFGAGVFFGAYMLHLVPDIEHLLQVYWLKPAGIKYPLPQLLVGLGFFMLIFIEQAMHMLKGVAERRNAAKNSTSSEVAGIDNPGCDVVKGDIKTTPIGEDKIDTITVVDTSAVKRVASEASLATVESERGLLNEEEPNVMKVLVMFVALSSDCIFEGLSLGLQSTVPGVWNFVIAILSHEVVIAFMLGVELLKHYKQKQVFYLGLFYALTNPIGVVIGIGIHATMDGDDVFEVVSGVLQALCGGVFIYVTFLELLAREFAGSTSLVKSAAVLSGFLLMALLKLVPHGDIAETLDHLELPSNHSLELPPITDNLTVND